MVTRSVCENCKAELDVQHVEDIDVYVEIYVCESHMVQENSF